LEKDRELVVILILRVEDASKAIETLTSVGAKVIEAKALHLL